MNTTTTSVLQQLRSLIPDRQLTAAEALQRVELQAHRLLQLHHIADGPVPNDIVSSAPRIRVTTDWDLPAAGSAHWAGTEWIITLKAGEPARRKRFSLFHEYAHIVWHPHRHLLPGTDEFSERLADYFAACVLMPKPWVKAAFCTETQRITELADRFQVSPQAISVRLDALGLVSQRRRRPTAVVNSGWRQQHTVRYFRQRSVTTIGAAP